MRNGSNVTLRKLGLTLAFYDPLETDKPLRELEKRFMPRRLAEAIALVKVYNEKAVQRPKLTELLAIFPRGEVQQ